MPNPANTCPQCGKSHSGSSNTHCLLCGAELQTHSEKPSELSREEIEQALAMPAIDFRRKGRWVSDDDSLCFMGDEPDPNINEPQKAFNKIRNFRFLGLSLDSTPADVIALGGIYSIEDSHPEIDHEVFEIHLTEGKIAATVQFLSAQNERSLIFRRLMSIQIIAPIGLIVHANGKSPLETMIEDYGEAELIEDSIVDCRVYKWFAIDRQNTHLTIDPETKQNVPKICQPGQSYTALYRRFRKVEAEALEYRDNFLVHGFLSLKGK